MYVSDTSSHSQLLLKEDLWDEHLICQNLRKKWHMGNMCGGHTENEQLWLADLLRSATNQIVQQHSGLSPLKGKSQNWKEEPDWSRLGRKSTIISSTNLKEARLSRIPMATGASIQIVWWNFSENVVVCKTVRHLQRQLYKIIIKEISFDLCYSLLRSMLSQPCYR